MFFTFSEEPSYGVDATSQDYVVDLVSEEVITNINYHKIRQFNSPTSKTRIPGLKTGKGRIALEMTYGNYAWNVLFKVLVGAKITLSNFSFAKSSESWKIVIGMLDDDLESSSLNFTISEYKSCEFDNVAGIIVGSEYIAIDNISNGVAVASERGSEGTTATSHNKYSLCYGVVVDSDKNIDIIYRYRDGFSYYLPTSLTSMIYREGDYFEFNGCLFSDFVFNAYKNTITSSFQLHSKNTRVIKISDPSTEVDTGQMVSPLDINCYSMGQEILLRKLYLQVSNTLVQRGAKFFDTTFSKILLSSHSAYGQFTLDDESIAAYNSYINDEMKNFSVTMCDSSQLDNVYVFSFNEIRYGTLLRVLYSSIDLKGDSVPFFCYDPDGFNILTQYSS